MATLLISHPSFLEHDTGPYHPERPDRLRAILSILEDPAFDSLVRLAAPAASMEEMTRVHPQDYVEAILGIRPGPGEHVQVDGDTVMSQGSAEAIQRAAGAVVAGVEAVMEGKVQTAFAAVRPPGHHAAPDVPGGFCLINNAAVGARHAQAKYGVGAGRDRRFRRPSRPGHAGRRRARSLAVLRLDASISALSRHRLVARDRHRTTMSSTCRSAPARAAPSSAPPGASASCRCSTRSRPSSSSCRRASTPIAPIRWRSSRSRPRISSG